MLSSHVDRSEFTSTVNGQRCGDLFLAVLRAVAVSCLEMTEPFLKNGSAPETGLSYMSPA